MEAEQLVEIDWDKPANQGSPITAYQVVIRHKDGTSFTEDTVNCDGTDSNIISTRKCQIPVSVLRAAPYNLEWGDSVYAKVAAINAVGQGAYSNEYNGAVIITYPDPPTGLQNDQSTTTSSVIGLTWTAPTFQGGTTVIDYRVKVASDGSSSFQVLASNIAGTSWSTDALSSGSSYNFVVEARNSFGYSETTSNEVTVMQAQPPD